MKKLTFFYIVEPADYQIMACTLLASIRTYFGDDVQAIGYCPAHRTSELHPAVLKAHEMMNAEIRSMQTEDMWGEPYPHGNKIIASLQPRDCEYSAFVDSDVMFLHPNNISNILKSGHVSCSLAASMIWARQSIWNDIYKIFDLPVPEERVSLMRRGTNMVPYYSSGLVVFPEARGPQGRFADVWYETACAIDRDENIPGRRPYLDQLSLPIAIQQAGLKCNRLPEEQHFILGGIQRTKPFPTDRNIYTVHYRNLKLLREVGLRSTGQRILRDQIGVSYVQRLAET